VYGVSEWQKEKISQAQYIANPGCFATAINLALAPLAKAKLLPERVTVFAATGSTGSGASPVAGTHHPHRANNYKLYKVLKHQHTPEIEMFLADLGAPKTQISFIPASAPMTHGIFATAHLYLKNPEEAAQVIKDAYESAPFVRVRTQSPHANWVTGSNFADIAVFPNGDELVIACVIDNLVKGASGQAIQNMNLMLGLPEELGLIHTFPSFP
jgi:N-acetyl-gamma-glutamyl-phosphate reductase